MMDEADFVAQRRSVNWTDSRYIIAVIICPRISWTETLFVGAEFVAQRRSVNWTDSKYIFAVIICPRVSWNAHASSTELEGSVEWTDRRNETVTYTVRSNETVTDTVGSNDWTVSKKELAVFICP